MDIHGPEGDLRGNKQYQTRQCIARFVEAYV